MRVSAMGYRTLAEELAEHIVDSMDLKTVVQIAYEVLLDEYRNMSETELVEFAREHAPHLIDEEGV